MGQRRTGASGRDVLRSVLASLLVAIVLTLLGLVIGGAL